MTQYTHFTQQKNILIQRHKEILIFMNNFFLNLFTYLKGRDVTMCVDACTESLEIEKLIDCNSNDYCLFIRTGKDPYTMDTNNNF